MSKRFIISGKQSLTSTGKTGAAMFVLSPMFGGLFLLWLNRELGRAYSGNPVIPAALLTVCGLTFLTGLVLIIIGRQFSYSAQEEEPAQTKGLWSK